MLFRPDKSSVCSHLIGVDTGEKCINSACDVLVSHVKYLLLTNISAFIFVEAISDLFTH
jgi:hypothetical protein